jgi:putative ubiquitin-RnfH superfamily antitoxin RatB of RatAB toxin-antitoxin module
MRHYFIALGLLGCSQLALAETDPFVSMGLFFAPMSEVETDPGGSIDGSGFGARVEVGGALHVHGEYLQSSLDDNAGDVDFSDTRLGMSYRSHMENGYILASAEYVGLDFDANGDDQGVGVHLGAGINAGDKVALYGRVGMLALDDLDGPEMRLGVDAKLQEGTSIYGEYRTAMLSSDGTDVDVNDLRVGVRFSF